MTAASTLLLYSSLSISLAKLTQEEIEITRCRIKDSTTLARKGRVEGRNRKLCDDNKKLKIQIKECEIKNKRLAIALKLLKEKNQNEKEKLTSELAGGIVHKVVEELEEKNYVLKTEKPKLEDEVVNVTVHNLTQAVANSSEKAKLQLEVTKLTTKNNELMDEQDEVLVAQKATQQAKNK